MSSRAAARPRRAVLAALVVTSLLALPIPALAAKGTAVSYGVAVLGQVDARTVVVAPGEPIAFRATFTNAPSGTLTHFRFDGDLPGGSLVDYPAPCAPDGPGKVACDLGSLAAGQSVELDFVYDAPTSIGLVTFSGRFSADAKKGNTSAAKVDVWEESPTIEVTTSADAFGRWQRSHGVLTFPGIGVAGDQRSTVRATQSVAFDYLLQLRHTADDVICAGSVVPGFGKTLDVSVANGTTPVVVTLEYGAQAAGGRSPGQVAVVHQGVTGCSFPPANCKLNAGFCYDASWSGGGANKTLVIRVELPNNGKIRGI